MKKTYMAPQTAVFHIEPATLIAESLGLNGDSGNKLGAGEILSKGPGDWDIWGDSSDDDDYEDY